MNDSEKQILPRTYEHDFHQAYVELADHPHEVVSGLVAKTVRIHNLIDGYDDPGIAIDFDQQGRAAGIEILYDHDGEE